MSRSVAASLVLLSAPAFAQALCFETNIGPNLNLGFAAVASVPLGFTFPGPGGPVSSIDIAANGFVWLVGSTNPGIDITPASFATAPRIAALWTLLDPSMPGGSVNFNVLPPAGGDPTRAVVTWDTPDGGGGPNLKFQLQLLQDGRVRILHDAANQVSIANAIVGVSGGGSVQEVDLSRIGSAPVDSGANPVLMDFMPFVTSVGATYDLAGMAWEFIPNGLGGYIAVELLQCRTGGFDRIGTGCPKPSTFYDYFQAGSTVNLGNQSFAFAPNGFGGFVGTPATGGMFTGYANNLNLGLFGIATSLALPWPWPHPAGAATSIDVTADGLVWLNGGAPGNYSPCCDGDILQWLGFGVPAIAPLWIGLDPSVPGAGVFFDVASSGSAVYVTWLNAAAANGFGTATFQLALFPDGSFEFHYGSIGIDAENALAGYTTGASQDPGNRDLRNMPWDSGVASGTTLTLNAVAGTRPSIGTTFGLEIDGLGAVPAIGGLAIAGAPLDADLAPLATGCRAYLDFVTPGVADIQVFLANTQPYTLSFAVPNSPALVGQNAFVQAGEVRSGANAVGIVFSNGGLARIGN